MESAPLDDHRLKELVAQAQAGSTEAFGEVYDLCFQAVYRYAAFRLPRELAEDAVADIFVKAWEKLHSYKVHKDVPFAAWLFRIARYTIIDVYRSQRDFEEVPETLVDTDALNQTDSALHRREIVVAVRAAMDKLPKRYREVLMLTFVAGLPHNVVAEFLGTSEGSVRILKLRALRKLESFLPADLDPRA